MSDAEEEVFNSTEGASSSIHILPSSAIHRVVPWHYDH